MLLKNSLSPVSKNFKDGWALFTSQVKPFFLIGLLEAVSCVFVAFVLGIITAGGIFGKLISLGIDNKLTEKELLPILFASLPSLSLALVAILVILGIISSIFVVARIESMTGVKKFSDLLKKGKEKMLMAFGLNLLTGLIFFGNLWLFMIPGLIVVYLTSFALFELVTEGKSIMDSIKRSMAIVLKNFWPVLGRALLMGIVLMIINGVFSGSGENREALSGISWIVSTLTGWYSIAYSYVLYKEASAITPKNYKPTLAWIMIPAVAGWLIFASLVFFGFNTLKSTGAFEDFWGNLEESIIEDKIIEMPDNLTNLDETS